MILFLKSQLLIQREDSLALLWKCMCKLVDCCVEITRGKEKCELWGLVDVDEFGTSRLLRLLGWNK